MFTQILFSVSYHIIIIIIIKTWTLSDFTSVWTVAVKRREKSSEVTRCEQNKLRHAAGFV